MSSELASIIAERDRILLAVDTAAARAFAVKHGGSAWSNLDWRIVIHLARWEATSLPEDARQESRIVLARAGKYGISQMPPTGAYVQATLDLLFPRRLFAEDMRATEAARGAT